MAPNYLETFRRAAKEAQKYEKNEFNEKRGKDGGLNSLNSFISYPGNSQNFPATVCAVCKAPGDLWAAGAALVHRECAEFLPRPELAEPTAAYRATSTEPDGTSCEIEIVELPATGLRYRRTFAHLQLRPPAFIPDDRWRQCVADGRAFLQRWGSQAESLGWDSRDLFGLHTPPARPHPSYSRLSRYDATGLIWLLEGREVVALTAHGLREPVVIFEGKILDGRNRFRACQAAGVVVEFAAYAWR
jgi:hypothetical protein